MEEWRSEPFEPEIRDGNLYGRGVADDKGQFYTWVAALDLMKAQGLELPVNIKILVEGAEEEGSRGLAQFVQEHKELLAADVCVLSDTHCLSEDLPVITYGLRGLVYFEITVRTLRQDVHSGIYGGNVLNAAAELTKVLASLKNEDSKILIPGFYDKVRELGEEERVELAQFPFVNENILEETGATVVVGEKNHTIPERAGARPSLDIHGLWSGYQSEGTKTIIPAVAGAKVSMRLVPFQKPKDVANKFRAYLEGLTPDGANIEVKELSANEPVLMDRSSDYFRSAERAYLKVFGRKPLYELSGGSIGVTVDFKRILGIDSVMMGYGLPDDGLHGPNEKMSLKMFEKGIETNMEFLKSLGEK